MSLRPITKITIITAISVALWVAIMVAILSLLGSTARAQAYGDAWYWHQQQLFQQRQLQDSIDDLNAQLRYQQLQQEQHQHDYNRRGNQGDATFR